MHRSLILAMLVACGPPPPPPNTDGDCMTDEEEASLGTDPASPDSDGDGLPDCDELDLGTDPLAEDGDGDGMTDAYELGCLADPNDADDVCYECGWLKADPGDLQSDGADEGDTIANAALVDQCGETMDLWDRAQEYHILFMTAAW